MLQEHEAAVRDSWDRVWETKSDFAPVNLRHDTISNLIRETIKLLGDARVIFLDIGSGPGSRTVPIVALENGFPLILLDQSATALTLARNYSLQSDTNTYQIQADAFKLPFRNETLECVFSNGLNEHFLEPQRQGLFDEMVRITKPGGRVAVIVPNKLNPFHSLNKFIAEKTSTWRFGPQYDFTPQELKLRMRKAGLEAIQMHGIGAFTSWIRILPREKQDVLCQNPVPIKVVSELLWKLDENTKSSANLLFGREILAIGQKLQKP